MNTVKLSSGAVVRVRPVPPHVGYQLYRQGMAALPPEPKAPMSKIRSAAGHEELVIADRDSPEYQEWQTAHAAWREQKQELDRQADQRNADFALDYSIAAWKLPAPWYRRPFQRWQTEPPADWQIPDVIARHGAMRDSSNRRLDFIKVMLLGSVGDMERVRMATVETVAPLRSDEVAAAFDGFPTDAGRGTAADGNPGRE